MIENKMTKAIADTMVDIETVEWSAKAAMSTPTFTQAPVRA
ncbi:MAG: hypothetical protein NTU53_18420 [Planctomycetota bacterium]|nr:hypothetical protein [Planctomycetota bacterium]